MTLPAPIVGFLRATEALSETCISHPWGTVVRNRAFADVHDANHAFVYDVFSPPLAELRAAVNAAQRATAVAFTQVEVLDIDDRPQLMADLTGWLGPPGEVFVLMATSGRGPAPSAHTGVTEADFPDAQRWLQLVRAGHSDAEGFPWEVIGELVARDSALRERAPVRFFTAQVDGEVAAYASLLSVGDVGLIDNVATVPAQRRRGLGAAVVGSAISASAARGNGTTFLFARERGDAQRLYARLGMEVLSRSAQFHHPGPPGD